MLRGCNLAGACIGGDDPERMVLYLATAGTDFQILEPPEVAAAARIVGERLRRAGQPP